MLIPIQRLLQELIDSHSYHDSADYQECDIDPCNWCLSAKEYLMQIGGDHYTKMQIQPVQFIHANRIPFIEGTIIKYVSRWKSKGGLQDLEKARHMVSMLIAYGPDEHAVYMPDLTRAVDDYVSANDIPPMEALIIEYVVIWRQTSGVYTLKRARSLLDIMISNRIREVYDNGN